MLDWKKTLVQPDNSIKEAISVLDKGGIQMVMVVDSKLKLLGSLTDGDVRRGILAGVNLTESVTRIMRKNPMTVSPDALHHEVKSLMITQQFRQVPVVRADGCVVGLRLFADLSEHAKKDTVIVLMVGGLGTRLNKLTEGCPKPLLKVGGKPILETIIEMLASQGFWKIYLTVNYKAEMIMEYFGDGSSFGVEITYINEKERMGTAGALSLLPQKPSERFIVMNGDLLTKVNFSHLLDFHAEHKSEGTMCVREYDFRVPYGVVNIEDAKLVGIEEKPLMRFFVNGGIYVLNPAVLDLVKEKSFLDMTTLFESMLQEKLPTSVFPIREYWIDIGQIDDFNRASTEFDSEF